MWSVWMAVPGDRGWSRIAGGLSATDARWIAHRLLFPARAMPDETT